MIYNRSELTKNQRLKRTKFTFVALYITALGYRVVCTKIEKTSVRYRSSAKFTNTNDTKYYKMWTTRHVSYGAIGKTMKCRPEPYLVAQIFI